MGSQHSFQWQLGTKTLRTLECSWNIMRQSLGKPQETPRKQQENHRKPIRNRKETIGKPYENHRNPYKTIGTPQKTIGNPQKTIGPPQKTMGHPQKTIGKQQETKGKPQEHILWLVAKSFTFLYIPSDMYYIYISYIIYLQQPPRRQPLKW